MSYSSFIFYHFFMHFTRFSPLIFRFQLFKSLQEKFLDYKTEGATSIFGLPLLFLLDQLN